MAPRLGRNAFTRAARRWSAAALLALAAAAPASAGQSGAGFAWSPGLPPPADTGKPATVSPPAATAGAIEPQDCLPELPCGTRLLGTLRRNGAVELQVPALRW